MKNPTPKYNIFGEELSLAEVALLAGVTVDTVRARIRAGKTIEEAVSVNNVRYRKAIETGDMFGRLWTIQPIIESADGRVSWICGCSCGSSNVVVRESQLRDRSILSCGCVRVASFAHAENYIKNDLTNCKLRNGSRVLGLAHKKLIRPDGREHDLWACRCACGETFEAIASQIRKGRHTRCTPKCTGVRS